MKTTIYADFNATTPVGSGAREAMLQAMEKWGNPSSSHALGRVARGLMEDSRRDVAKALGVEPAEVVFTSGGSEANATVLLGTFLAGPEMRLLTSSVEHSSIKDTCALLQARGVAVEALPVGADGLFSLQGFCEAVDRFKPTLVSLMLANNETGVLFPIAEVASELKKRNILFHTDAVQAFGKVPSKEFLDADFVSVSAHKIYGPKGVGALIVRKGRKLVATHYGGSQETKRRGGTENMVGIAGFAGACRELGAGSDVRSLRDHFEKRLAEAISDVQVQGVRAPRLPNTSNIRFPGISSEVLLGALDIDGVCVSAGSACSSGSITPSHVLIAMGLSNDAAKECMRVSWGRTTTREHVDMVVDLMISHVKRIRSRK